MKSQSYKLILYLFLVILQEFLNRKLNAFSRNKGINGTALAITNLLLCVEVYKVGRFNNMKNKMSNNAELVL